MSEFLDPRKIGMRVECRRCFLMKRPLGRSGPIDLGFCDEACEGYDEGPHVGLLWPDESEAEFGYPVGDVGVRWNRST